MRGIAWMLGVVREGRRREDPRWKGSVEAGSWSGRQRNNDLLPSFTDLAALQASSSSLQMMSFQGPACPARSWDCCECVSETDSQSSHVFLSARPPDPIQLFLYFVPLS